MNTPEAKQKLLNAFPEFKEKKVTVITNGFDSMDFVLNKEKSKNNKFTIVHTGHLHTELGLRLEQRYRQYRLLGGVLPGLNILSRSHVFLLKALEKWLKSSPHRISKIKLVLAGRLSKSDKNIVLNSNISECVEMMGYISHTESISLLQKADLLFLPMHNMPKGVRSTIVPGKTYEYMATGLPILGAVPEGDARDFLEKCGCGLICAPDDEEAMVNIIEKVFNEWNNDSCHIVHNSNFILKFERKALADKLAKFFKKLITNSSANLDNPRINSLHRKF
jgi:glycosyltransferase involved in cell wall biosynthesis